MGASILITGAAGMLGRTLSQRFSGQRLHALMRQDLDITVEKDVFSSFEKLAPDVVIHCAAMTQVDLCESEQEQAYVVNQRGSENIARASQAIGARLIGISTDYVFRGDGERPYCEEDETQPQTVYGQSKLAGERAILELCEKSLVARVAWLYGPSGPSFLHTMLRLGQVDGDPLQVVNDQIGNPTSTLAVAAHLELLLETDLSGIVHLTCEGEATWFDFTRAIFQRTGLSREVESCTSDVYPRPAPRPANSRLEKSVLARCDLPPMPSWQEALDEFLRLHPKG